jgi:hypothetical protein
LVDTTDLRVKRVSEKVPRIMATGICPFFPSFSAFPLPFLLFMLCRLGLPPLSSQPQASVASVDHQQPLSLLSRPLSGQLGSFRFRKGRKGNSVRIGDGPAAVTGDERCTHVTDPPDREDATSRMSRKSEDLPGHYDVSPWIRDGRGVSVEKSGPPDQFLLVRGLFFVLDRHIFQGGSLWAIQN